ncbi:MAG: peptidoglycan DD-metalloendopeptidase family protein [Candidatus Saganbacteria bacterium]|nr:peptidoglycan DD-metalloendopeptidase family protein [Candidatus Saganbacteria bacterium]
MSDFINRSYFFSKLVETDVNLINLVSEQNKSIKTKRQNLEGVTTEIKQLADIINTKQNEISVKRKEEQRVYAALKGRRLNYEKRIAKLERSSVELTQIIQNKVGKHVTAKGSGLLEWPLRGRITSRYGYRRHPYWGGRQMHRGLDIAAPYGRPIKAADGGVVIMAKWWDGYGKAVVISHGRKTSTVYGHMSRIYVQTDDKVAKGQIIGLVGSTGYSTGPHLHFEVRKNGKPTNPIKYLP